jgi:hypothetical protein
MDFMSQEERHYYGTQHELRFLADLGTFSKVRLPRLHLLLGYRAAMGTRAWWGNIDPLKVGKAVEQAIITERQRTAAAKEERHVSPL